MQHNTDSWKGDVMNRLLSIWFVITTVTYDEKILIITA